MMPSVKVTNMAFDIEFELWSVSKHLSSIYKQRASSLMRILRRSSSEVVANCVRKFCRNVSHCVLTVLKNFVFALQLKCISCRVIAT